jgi:hypothetical protein
MTAAAEGRTTKASTVEGCDQLLAGWWRWLRFTAASRESEVISAMLIPLCQTFRFSEAHEIVQHMCSLGIIPSLAGMQAFFRMLQLKRREKSISQARFLCDFWLSELEKKEAHESVRCAVLSEYFFLLRQVRQDALQGGRSTASSNVNGALARATPRSSAQRLGLLNDEIVRVAKQLVEVHGGGHSLTVFSTVVESVSESISQHPPGSDSPAVPLLRRTVETVMQRLAFAEEANMEHDGLRLEGCEDSIRLVSSLTHAAAHCDMLDVLSDAPMWHSLSEEAFAAVLRATLSKCENDVSLAYRRVEAICEVAQRSVPDEVHAWMLLLSDSTTAS